MFDMFSTIARRMMMMVMMMIMIMIMIDDWPAFDLISHHRSLAPRRVRRCSVQCAVDQLIVNVQTSDRTCQRTKSRSLTGFDSIAHPPPPDLSAHLLCAHRQPIYSKSPS
jgi:hypothetical protein